MYKVQRKLLSQNFLRSRKLVSHLVGSFSLGKNDVVLEIGPGKGIITEQLLNRGCHVIAVELDPQLCVYLREKFRGNNRLTLYQADFLTHPLPQFPYKVFANIPFAVEGKIIRKLIEAPNPPRDCYLVVRSELAERLIAKRKNTMFTLMHKPWFDFSIMYHFRPWDFTPPTKVRAVLFRFTLKTTPLLPFEERAIYQQFIRNMFVNGQSIRNALKRFYPIQNIDEILHQLSLSKKVKPGEIHIKQAIALYKKLCR